MADGFQLSLGDLLSRAVADEPGVRHIRPPGGIHALVGGNPGSPSMQGAGQLKLLPDLKRIQSMMDQADVALPRPAQEAVTGFVGHPPMARNKENDFTGAFGLMNAKPLEMALRGEDPHGILRGIEEAFAPVREQLRSEYGSTIPLSRVQFPVKPDQRVVGFPEDQRRLALSWTADPAFARDYAGTWPEQRPFSEHQISQAEKQFDTLGQVTIPGTKYQLKGLNRYTDFRGEPRTSIDIYEGSPNRWEHLTDTDNVRSFMSGLNEDRAAVAARNADRLKRVLNVRMPLDDILFGTHRAGQTEFIVRNQPEQQVWIDPTGQIRSR